MNPSLRRAYRVLDNLMMWQMLSDSFAVQMQGGSQDVSLVLVEVALKLGISDSVVDRESEVLGLEVYVH